MKLALLGILSCLYIQAQQASLEGVVVDAATQSPLAGAHISLVSASVGTDLPGRDDAYGAISDSAGHFAIANIQPGSYRLRPRRNGFIDYLAAPADAILALNSGEQRRELRIAMTPEATIAGRVTDEFGDPMERVNVRLIPAGDGQKDGNLGATTDDRGEYRISGLPGQYFVRASVPEKAGISLPEIRSDGTFPPLYADTFYPGSLAKERAKPVDALPGREATGIDIRFTPRRNAKIRGTVSGLRPNDAARATVIIRIDLNNSEAEDHVSADASGSFVFSNLAPSDYWLWATYPSTTPGEPLRSSIVHVAVENEDVTVALRVDAGSEKDSGGK
jgi:hypothetical protein